MFVPAVPPHPESERPRRSRAGAWGGKLSAFDVILGESPAAEAIRAFGRRAAEVDAPVLITGETGTGKGVLARAIHTASLRCRAPFVAVNCASVPESLFESEFFGHDRGAFTGAQQAHRGLVEQAHRGTLFLDEVGELAHVAQAKLLTALEDGEFRRVGGERAVHADVRLVAATGVRLERAVAAGSFRRDLYHRLLVLSIRLPPLRERPGDVQLLARHFLAGLRERYGPRVRRVDPGLLRFLEQQSWPGNVRQLAHALEAAVLACQNGVLHRRHLPTTLLEPLPVAGSDDGGAPHAASVTRPEDAGSGTRYSFLGSAAEERRRIEEALRRWRGNKTRAAAELGMARNTLRAKLRRHRIGGVES
jgi:DNA-binding NtrC family response regulator